MAMGRPTKFTVEKGKAICENLRIGCTRTAAVQSLGIKYDTFLDWVATKPNFRSDVQKAEAEAEKRYTGVIMAAATPHEVVEQTQVDTYDTEGQLTGRRVTTVTRREFDWRPAESWLKRRRRYAYGDSIDVRRLDDDTILRLLNSQGGGDSEGTALTESEYFREDQQVQEPA